MRTSARASTRRSVTEAARCLLELAPLFKYLRWINFGGISTPIAPAIEFPIQSTARN
jgi:hypothetical protein